MPILNSGEVLYGSLQTLWTIVVTFLPNLFLAVIVLLFGWIIGVAFGTVVQHMVKALRIDDLFAKLEIEQVLERAGWKFEASVFLGAIVKWFFLIAFLLAAVNILGLSAVSSFLLAILNYIPNVFVAAFILIIGAVFADIAERLVRGASDVARHPNSSFVGVVIRWSIWIFSIFAALLQLGVAEDLVRTLITGIVAMVAIAGGLAFGLGGKDLAADWLDTAKSRMKGK